MYGAGFLVILLSLTITVSAGGSTVVPVPEIDGGSVTMGLGLLSGGLMILRARWVAKNRQQPKED
jgi:hypothetical protein